VLSSGRTVSLAGEVLQVGMEVLIAILNVICVRTYVRTLPNFTAVWKWDHTKVKRKLCLNFGWEWSGHGRPRICFLGPVLT